MNTMLLKWHMAHNKDDVQTLAKALGIHANTLYNKLNEKSKEKFTQDEIFEIVKRYKLTGDDLISIFFNAGGC